MYIAGAMHNSMKLAKLNDKNGFTLVELMVVIAIIAIIAAVGIAIFTTQQTAARDARRKADIESISQVLESHYNQSTNQYCTAAAYTYCAPLTTWFSNGAIPVDPSTQVNYSGLPANGAATYNVCATLEAGGTYCKAYQQS